MKGASDLCQINNAMQLYRVKDHSAMSKKAADFIAAQVILKPSCVLGLATGSTPVDTYRLLAQKYASKDLDFSRTFSVNLDEYKGLSPEHPQSYRYFMNHQLFDHINLSKERTFIPDGTAENAREACLAYDEKIRSLGGIDLQLLGIGGNGHIGFNEPGDCFIKNTHLVTLTEETRRANARFFSSPAEVPTHAYTMGIGNILSAKRILLLASGSSKAQALFDTVCGPVTPQVPASILQLHPDVTIIGDEEAFSLIPPEEISSDCI